MTFKCKIGFHSWNGCKCSVCGKIRDNLHNWDGCKCTKCGKVNDGMHDWTKDCEKCSKCGKTIENQHDWTKNCEKCAKCGKIRENIHRLANDCEKCSKCGKTFENQHDWTKNCEKCAKCIKTRENQHDWTKDCEKCSICGKTNENQHIWNGSKCSKCGKNLEYKQKSVSQGFIRYAFLVASLPDKPTEPQMYSFLFDLLPELKKQPDDIAILGFLWETKPMNLIDMQALAKLAFGDEILNVNKYIYRTLHIKLKTGEAKCFVVHYVDNK